MESIASGNQVLAGQDWSRCEAGPPASWPPTLRLAVDILLDLPLPAVLMWDRKQIMFINSAYASLTGSAADSVPGGAVPLMPPAVWSWNPAALELAWNGQSQRFPAQTLNLWRDGHPDPRSFDLAYTPLRGENGAVHGLLCTLAPPSALSAPPAQPEAPMRILVVEDNLDAQYLVCEMLRVFGHSVQAVARAEDALATLQRDQFDVLFTDVSLPGMSGVDLARQALQQRPALRIVFASGYSQALTSQLEFPAVSMQKPYDIDQLQQALEQVAQPQP